MTLGMVGLGRMGSNMAKRLMKGGHSVVAFDLSAEAVRLIKAEGASTIASLVELRAQLKAPRVIWVMLPAGRPTEDVIGQLSEILEPGDTVVDGGNSYFKDDVRRGQLLRQKKIRFLDVGTSGGVWGLERGYSLMIGGDADAATTLDPIFRTLAPGDSQVEITPGRRTTSSADQGYLYCGPSGAGHFVKMVHNGIEYGMMQSLAEGFDILQGAQSEALPPEHRYQLDLKEISEVWRRGSVVSSWLLDLIAISFNHDSVLSQFHGRVPDSGEGRWTVQAALEESISAPIITNSLYVRFRSRESESFAEKLLSAMRSEFGGHVEAPLHLDDASKGVNAPKKA